MLDPTAAAAARVDIDAAFAILSDDERRRAYDRSLDGDDADVVRLAQSPAPAEHVRTTAPRTSTPPTLRFLAPVDDTASERAVVRKGGIVFAEPKTDVHDAAALVAAAREHAAEVVNAPVHFEAPTLVPRTTVLPTETIHSPWEPIAPEPTASVSSSSERRVGLPTAHTNTAGGAVFSRRRGQRLHHQAAARGAQAQSGCSGGAHEDPSAVPGRDRGARRDEGEISLGQLHFVDAQHARDLGEKAAQVHVRRQVLDALWSLTSRTSLTSKDGKPGSIRAVTATVFAVWPRMAAV